MKYSTGKNILVIGATGQIGSELTPALRERYGTERVTAAGHRREPSEELCNSGPFLTIDCTDREDLAATVREHSIGIIYHLAAILSARAEEVPHKAWSVNMNGLYNVLEVAREFGCAVFAPSSIAAFGPTTPAEGTPQDTLMRPTTMYGVTKAAGELLCDYYFRRFGVDCRGLRYPGLISYEQLPGGGTTDYAVEIYYEALRHGKYTCFLRAGTFLDMMYMPDAVRAAVELMEADPQKLKHRNAFNITSMSVDPEAIASAIRKHIPDFRLTYRVDPVRQAIADSWPSSIDDSAAREEFGWQPRYGLEPMTADMLEKLSRKLEHRVLKRG